MRARATAALPTLVLLAVLAGCAGRAPVGRDGPPAHPPADLHRVPDAEPRVEPLRAGGPNKPYTVRGRHYVPLARDAPLRDVGGASWYGTAFHGRPTALGEPYDMYAMTAAHKTMPLPSYARVRNPANGREVIVRVNDRGPFVEGRVIDLSYTAALRLGLLGGVAPVEVQRLTHDAIRSGGWARGRDTPDPADDVVALPADGDAAAAQSSTTGWWLQLGAFRDDAGARQLERLIRSELPWLSATLRALDDGSFTRVQAGPFASRHEARAAAGRIADALPLQPLVLAPR
jgi:rare lipoprotein A